MISDVRQLEREIRALEQAETNWANIEKLSLLYNVYDHVKVKSDYSGANRAESFVVPKVGSDEFCRTCQGVSIEPLMNILSEHMTAIKVLHPKEYEAVLEKIRGIS